MLRFTDPKLFLKGTAQAYLQDPTDNSIVYYSDKFQTANVATSVTTGEIRAGVGNPIVMMIPTDGGMTVNFVAADFNLFAKAAQTGAKLTAGGSVMVCQNVQANGTTLTIDVSGGTPVAAPGATDAVAFVQEVGASSPVATGGIAYPITAAGAITGFTATNGKTYKVWYHITRANAQVAAIPSLIDPKLLRFTAIMPVYSTTGGSANEGTHVGNLTIVVPALKLGGDQGGINGDQTGNDTTSITGQALAYDAATIDGSCEDCGGTGNVFAYYIYTPCDITSGIDGIRGQLGGAVSVAADGTVQLEPAVIVGNTLNRNVPVSDFTFTSSSTGTATVGEHTGIVSGVTEGSAEITVTYTVGSTTYTDYVNVTVTGA